MQLYGYDQPTIRQYLISQGLIDAAGNVIDAHGVWVAAFHYGVTGPQLDAAIPLPPGTADAYVRDAGLQALRGVDYSTESGNPAAPVPAPPPPPVVVTVIPTGSATMPYVKPPLVGPSGVPVNTTPAPLPGQGTAPAPAPVASTPNYLFDPNAPATVTIAPGAGATISQNAILWSVAALVGFLMLKKRG